MLCIRWDMPALRAAICLVTMLCAGASEPTVGAIAVPVQSPGVDPEYHVNPGDELEILVWGEDRLQHVVRVLPDGTFTFPLAGQIDAANHTMREIAARIRANIAPNYRETPPYVTVAVHEPAGMRFYVMGRVRAPGGFSSGRAVNVVQALSMAGGLAEFADVKHAIILRQTAQGQIVERLRLSAVLKGARGIGQGHLAEPLPVLGVGDVLVVP